MVLNELKPYLRHKNKLKDLTKVKQKIKERNLKFGNINM